MGNKLTKRDSTQIPFIQIEKKMAEEGVVTQEPTRLQAPGQWSTGMINASCCIASFIPCLTWVWAFNNAARVGQPGLCASQGCCCVYLCCPCATFLWTTKTRLYAKMRLGIQDGRNELCWTYCCFPCVVAQTRQSLVANAPLLAQQMWEEPPE